MDVRLVTMARSQREMTADMLIESNLADDGLLQNLANAHKIASMGIRCRTHDADRQTAERCWKATFQPSITTECEWYPAIIVEET